MRAAVSRPSHRHHCEPHERQCTDANEHILHLPVDARVWNQCILCASAATVMVYMEWAPLRQLAASGLLRACAFLLEVPDFRMDACEALRVLSLRRQAQVWSRLITLAAPGISHAARLSPCASSSCPRSWRAFKCVPAWLLASCP